MTKCSINLSQGYLGCDQDNWVTKPLLRVVCATLLAPIGIALIDDCDL